MKLVPLNLRDMRRNWEKMGKLDPYWAVLSDDAKKGSRWNPREFFATGEKEIEEILTHVRSLGQQPVLGQALDFGCGLGRLTQALGAHFAKATGVDISSSMIEQARTLNTRGERCEFVVNPAADLTLFGDRTFDFIYSSITLQHIEPVYSRVYLAEFARVLKPGGILVFQLPSQRSGEQNAAPAVGPARHPLKQLYWALRESLHVIRMKWIYRLKILRNNPIIPMHGIPRPDVEALLAQAGMRVVDVRPDQSAGPQWISFRYCVLRI